MNYKNVLDNILEIFPNFRPYYEEHIKDNGQILSHVLMGDLQRYFLNSFRSENLEECKKIILFLDSLLSKDPKIQELVYYSFLENLPQDNKEEYNKIVNLFTPNLRKALAEVDAFWENMEKMYKENNEIYQKLKKYFIEYDPVGLISGGAPEDEYDAEITTVYIKVFKDKTLTTTQEVYEFIIELFKTRYGTTSFNKDNVKKMSNQIVNLV